MNLPKINYKWFLGMLLFLGMLFYLISLFWTNGTVSTPKESVDYYIVSFAREDLSEQKVLETFGRPSVIGVTDLAYRLKLSKEKLAEFKDLNLSYTILPSDFFTTSSGYALWKVEFHPPLYNSKIQSIANYGTIVQENSDRTYLIWTNEAHAQSISSLGAVKNISSYLVYEKVDINLNSRLLEENFTAKLKVLVADNDIESIKNAVLSYGIKIIEEEDTLVIDDSFSTVVLNVELDFDSMKTALVSFPQLISVY